MEKTIFLKISECAGNLHAEMDHISLGERLQGRK